MTFANAQSFGNNTLTDQTVPTIQNTSATDDAIRNLFASTQTTQTTNKPLDTSSTETEDEDIFIPENELYRLDTPTVDGSVRGGEAFVMRDNDGRLRKVTNIFLFYDQFKINHAFGNFTSCDVRFNILSNLDRKISQLDVKLVWPKMTTTLSFSNVSPSTQLYVDYTLLGEGCYSMDKSPNIVVNRCRAKGMTAVECAKKILWVHQ